MTEKELLYFEDAIMHEKNVIKILELSINNLENNDYIEFLEHEKEIHNDMKNNLINMLEVKANE